MLFGGGGGIFICPVLGTESVNVFWLNKYESEWIHLALILEIDIEMPFLKMKCNIFKKVLTFLDPIRQKPTCMLFIWGDRISYLVLGNKPPQNLVS